MDRLREISCFVSVVEAGSFVRAADIVGVSKAAVSRAVLDLEQRLGMRLLHRNTRSLSLTDAGHDYWQRCKHILEELAEADDVVSADGGQVVGQLRISAPHSFGILHLAPLWPDFMRLHPGIRLDIHLSDRMSDIVGEGFDLAIRIAQLQDSMLAQRRLAGTRIVACAAPAYLATHGTPVHPAELERHQVIAYSYFMHKDEWHFDGNEGPVAVRTRALMQANNGDTCLSAALAGMGIILQPDFLVAPYIARRQLVPILPAYPVREMGIYAVFSSQRHLPLKVRAMIDFLVAAFDRVDWNTGVAGSRTPGVGTLAYAAAA
jgi:DNA-binding transcriptional LysR family regulator